MQPITQVVDAFYPTLKKEGSGPPQRTSVGELPSYDIMKKQAKSFAFKRRSENGIARALFFTPVQNNEHAKESDSTMQSTSSIATHNE